ncbi:MAG: DUF4962 domain-containing protein [Anaerolineae bacterium]|nr:DUF4962 domain-containing protein [Anaerolineae bacterium]
MLCLVLLLTPRGWARVGAQNGPEPALPRAASTTERPRLLLTQNALQSILIPRATAGAATWEALLRYVESDGPEQDQVTYPEQVTRALAVAYWVTGDADYAQRGRDSLLQNFVAVQSHPALASDAPWDSRLAQQIAGLAVGFDWLIPTLPEGDRQPIIGLLARAMTLLNDPARAADGAYVAMPDGTYRFASYDHVALEMLWAITATAIALWGEHSSASEWLDYARLLFTNWLLPTLDSQPGGAWAEGIGYGAQAHWASIQTLAAWWTAFGENYLDNTDWWADRLAYTLFASQPGIQRLAGQPQGLPGLSYPTIIGDTARTSETALLARAQDLLLAALIPGAPAAAWQNWLWNQTEDAALQGWMAVEEFLWRDPGATGSPPDRLLWITPETGHMFLRSAWADASGNLDRNATWLSFNAGDRYALRQFYDQGNLTLWRAGADLLTRSGVYSGLGSDHDANYHARTVAANTLLVCDISETFDNIRPNTERNAWLNDCGQRAIDARGGRGINPFFRAESAATYETSDILRYAEEGRLNYLRADLTAAYNSPGHTSPINRPKVQEVLREWVFIRPSSLVIYDRVRTTQPEFVPFALLHLDAPPTPLGESWWRVLGGESQLFLAGVAPQNTLEVIEGYQVAGETLPPRYNATESRDHGAYRVQFTPRQPTTSTEHFFLTLLVADTATALLPPRWTWVQGQGMVGVAWGAWQVMFDDDPGNLSQASLQVQPGVNQLLLTGLVPSGSYRVSLADGTQTDLVADSAGTLYIFNEQAGLVSLVTR